MKRILCPKCEEYITFDETKYDTQQPITLVCNHCAKQLTIRLKAPKNVTTPVNNNTIQLRQEDEGYGHITVVENAFAYKQQLPLTLGDNIIGRQSKGNYIQIPIITADPSMGRNHCIINVKQDKQGKLHYTLRDFPSLTGTYIGNKCLNKKEQITLTDGDIITLGATTIILNLPQQTPSQP